MTTNNKDRLKGQLRIAILIVIATWIIIPLIVIGLFGKPENSGTLGDTFGIVNALFSALAFALLIYTSLMQREELELQRKELELTRRELEKSAEAQTTLVNLTREQLELEKAIRKTEVRPELKFVSNGWRNSEDMSSYYKIGLGINYYRLKIDKVEFGLKNTNFRIDEIGLNKYKEKYHEPKDIITLALIPNDKDPIPIGQLSLVIHFRDIDGVLYNQTLTITDDNVQISSVKDFRWGTDI